MESHKLYNVRTINSLKDMLNQSASLFNGNNAFLLKSDGVYKGISYAEFKNDVDALGTSLISMGLKNKSIAIIGENRYEWCVSYLSVVNGTGIVVPMDKELPANELHNLLIKSNAAAVFYSAKFDSEMAALAEQLPQISYFIRMDHNAPSSIEEPESLSPSRSDFCSVENVPKSKFVSFTSLVKNGEKLMASGDSSFTDAEVDPECMSILLYTSGTTDFAKGVMLSHRNICFDITAVLSTVHIDCNDSTLSILPIHHTYECTLGFLAIVYSGGTISFNEGLKHILKNFKEVRPTIMLSVPLILENMHKKIWEQASKKKSSLLKLKIGLFFSNLLYRVIKIDVRKKLFKPIHENFGGKLRLIITGAAAVDPNVSKNLRAMGIPVLQGYGLTECAPLVIGNRDTLFKDASVGLPLPGIEARIDSPDNNGIGEIVVKGDNIMLGYYKNPEATAKVLKDGWFYTGDLGYKDKDGFYYITGRKKNVIVTKNGKNIFPEEIESYINKSLYIEESMVWGEYDEDTGETQVNAQIVPNFQTIKEKLKLPEISKEDILKVIKEEIKLINKNMPLYKRIKDFSIRESEFVKTTTKKIKRYVEKNIKKEK